MLAADAASILSNSHPLHKGTGLPDLSRDRVHPSDLGAATSAMVLRMSPGLKVSTVRTQLQGNLHDERVTSVYDDNGAGQLPNAQFYRLMLKRRFSTEP